MRELRKANRLTQAELAQRAGLSTISIARYETGKRDIDDDLWIKIAGILGLDEEQAAVEYFACMSDDIDRIKAINSHIEISKPKGLELLEIFFKLSSVGQKKLLDYALDLQSIYSLEDDIDGPR